ncbi:MAG: hypothetical protein ABUS56_07105 [Acidobacteriota bacterium]
MDTLTVRHARAVLLALLITTTAVACGPRTYPVRSGPAYGGVQRRGYDNGYGVGLDRGRDDRRHGRPFALERHGEYRDADRGFRRGDGERAVYREAFRHGFEDGYRAGFAGVDRRDGRRRD